MAGYKVSISGHNYKKNEFMAAYIYSISGHNSSGANLGMAPVFVRPHLNTTLVISS